MFNIRIAGVVVQIRNKGEYVHWLCKDYIVDDRIPPDISVSVTDEEIKWEIQKCMGKKTPMYMEKQYDEFMEYWEGMCINDRIGLEMIRFGGFVLHAAVISVDGEAYAFAAPSGTGKTTHMQLWINQFGDRAQVVNGDKPILRWFGNQLYACGTPWCGKEGLGQDMKAPLRALCFIERSETNSITRIDKKSMIGKLFYQMIKPEDEETLDLFLPMVEKMIAEIDCFLLRCNMQPEAAQVAWNGIQEARK